MTQPLVVCTPEELKAIVADAVRSALAQQTDEEPMTKAEAAEMLGCSERSITTYMAREGMPHEKRRGRPIFYKSKVREWNKGRR